MSSITSAKSFFFLTIHRSRHPHLSKHELIPPLLKNMYRPSPNVVLNFIECIISMRNIQPRQKNFICFFFLFFCPKCYNPDIYGMTHLIVKTYILWLRMVPSLVRDNRLYCGRMLCDFLFFLNW